VFSADAWAVTAMLSVTAPTSSVMSMRGVWAGARVIPSRTNFLKPFASTVIL
jgi:hypothetical protein